MRQLQTQNRLLVLSLAATLVLVLSLSGSAFADGGVVYNDITLNPASGLAWSRTPSPCRRSRRQWSSVCAPT